MARKTANKTVIIVCVDRDNDLGRKAGIEGPVIGRDINLQAAQALVLKDPTESDANTMFAAVRKYDELKNEFQNLEVVTLTGQGKLGFASDKRINEKLDALESMYSIQGFVMVTDGAEDDQVLPLLQSRARIISKEMVIIKQAKEVESAYYTIKAALEDPSIARVVFGIPGLILIVYGITLVIGAQTQFFQGVAFILGAYLLLKGFGLETKILKGLGHVTEGISVERVSFPFYAASAFILLFGIYTGYINYAPAASDVFTAGLTAVQSMYFFLVTSFLFLVTARTIDAVHLKRAYLLRKYIMYAVAGLGLWLIIDSASLVFLRQADLNFFLVSVLMSFVGLLLTFKATQVIDVRKKITALLVGLPVYNAHGKWLGKIKKIESETSIAYYKKSGEKELHALKQESLLVKKGKIVLNG